MPFSNVPVKYRFFMLLIYFSSKNRMTVAEIHLSYSALIPASEVDSQAIYDKAISSMKFGLRASIAEADFSKIDPAGSPLITLLLLEDGHPAGVKTARAMNSVQKPETQPFFDILDEKISFLEQENQYKSDEIASLEIELEELGDFIENQKSRNRYQQMANLNLAEKLYAKEKESEKISNLEKELSVRKSVETNMMSVLNIMKRQIGLLQARLIPK